MSRTSVKARARRAVRVTSFLGATAGFLGAWLARDAAIAARGATEDERELLRDSWTRPWCDTVLRIFGVRVIAIGEPVRHAEDLGHGRVVVSNHRGVIDVAVLMRTFGGRFVSRADLAGWPLLGFGARKLGTVFVDRENTSSGAATIRQMRDLLAARRTICIFPEGTTFPGDEVHPFHGGAFLATSGAGADVEIVPVGLAYSRRSQAAFVEETFPEHLARMAAAERSFVVASVGRPIERGPRPRAAELATRAREAVAAEVARARAKADELDSRGATSQFT